MADTLLAGLRRVAGRAAVCCRSLKAATEPGQLDYEVQESFPAASVIKAGIMACLLRDVAEGRYQLTDRIALSSEEMVGGAGVLYEMEPRSYTLAELCTLMMVVSDNTASNACLRQVEMSRLHDFFQSRGYQAKIQRYFMQPVEGGRDNAMTAESAALMLADLYGGKGLNPELTEFAKGCLRRQQYREKIPLMLPENVIVGHKTGELEGVRHDAAVIEVEEPYLLVILTADGGEPWEVDREMALLSKRVYERAAAETVPS